MTDRFLIIGGGIRLREAYNSFLKNGFNAKFYTGDTPLKVAIDNADVIVLGLPASKDDVLIASEDVSITLRDLAALCTKRKLVLGGLFSEKTKALFDIYSVRWADYAKCPEFEILNAVPTAEGAIALAMDEFPFTLHSSKTIVTGFGKVAKALSLRLAALGSDCTIVARNPARRAECQSLGFKAIDFPELPQQAKNCQILFNTVPHLVCTREVLANIAPSCGVIDLASKPGGCDLDAAKTLGVNVIWALSLPGKVAPATAGEIIQKTACSLASDLRLQS